jgi:UDP-N-acetylmuramyl tripeptide synthase
MPGVRCALAAASAALAAGIPFADVLRALNEIQSVGPPGA